jgi:hypothetical protein
MTIQGRFAVRTLSIMFLAGAMTANVLAQPVQRDDTSLKFSVRPHASAESTENKPYRHNYVELVGGGMVWSSEDPALRRPTMTLSVSAAAAIENGIVEPINVSIFTNYAAFMERVEVLVYAGEDVDLTQPLFVQTLSPTAIHGFVLDIPNLNERRFMAGDQLRIVVKAYDGKGHFDETFPQVVELIHPSDREKQLAQQHFNANAQLRGLSSSELEQRQLFDDSFTRVQWLRRQNIPIYGSNIRINGQHSARSSTGY